MPHHHDRLFIALCDELDELAPLGYDTKDARYLWGIASNTEEKRRSEILTLIGLLRVSRLSEDLRIIQNLAYPMRIATNLRWYRDVFRGSPVGAAGLLADLVAQILRHDAVVAHLQKSLQMRQADHPKHSLERALQRAYLRLTKTLAHRDGEIRADTLACTYRAAGMEWDDFLEFLEAEQTRILGQLHSRRESPRVARIIAALEAVPALVTQINQEDGDQ